MTIFGENFPFFPNFHYIFPNFPKIVFGKIMEKVGENGKNVFPVEKSDKKRALILDHRLLFLSTRSQIKIFQSNN